MNTYLDLHLLLLMQQRTGLEEVQKIYVCKKIYMVTLHATSTDAPGTAVHSSPITMKFSKYLSVTEAYGNPQPFNKSVKTHSIVNSEKRRRNTRD